MTIFNVTSLPLVWRYYQVIYHTLSVLPCPHSYIHTPWSSWSALTAAAQRLIINISWSHLSPTLNHTHIHTHTHTHTRAHTAHQKSLHIFSVFKESYHPLVKQMSVTDSERISFYIRPNMQHNTHKTMGRAWHHIQCGNQGDFCKVFCIAHSAWKWQIILIWGHQIPIQLCWAPLIWRAWGTFVKCTIILMWTVQSLPARQTVWLGSGRFSSIKVPCMIHRSNPQPASWHFAVHTDTKLKPYVSFRNPLLCDYCSETVASELGFEKVYGLGWVTTLTFGRPLYMGFVTLRSVAWLALSVLLLGTVSAKPDVSHTEAKGCWVSLEMLRNVT